LTHVGPVRWTRADRLVGEAGLDSTPDTVDEDVDEALPPGVTEDEARRLSTRDLSSHLFERLSLLVKEQVNLARLEMKRDLGKAKLSGALLGGGAVMLLCALFLLFVAVGQVIGMALPPPVGSVIMAGAALLVGVPLVLFGMRRLPEPMAGTRHELKEGIAWTKTRLA
jgi:hypothetical protein